MNSTSTWLSHRAAGVLAHVSSLPGELGIGNLGTGARDFVDFLAGAGFGYWQICPLGPTGYGDSPYQSFSSYAGNPYFIDLTELVEPGLLTEKELAPLRELPQESVDYGLLYDEFWDVLEIAYERFSQNPVALPGFGELEEFKERHRAWLQAYALFMGIKDEFGGLPWNLWEPSWRDGFESAERSANASIRRRADHHLFYQYLFEGQWRRLKRYAQERGVEIIGDLPIFVALDSSDTWQSPEVFRIDREGEPLAYAGVPPDYFSEYGQFWGNPLYDWDQLKGSNYRWWIERLRRAFDLYDVLRLDHFRGFDTFWEIPAGSSDARVGQWCQGPGLRFFAKLQEALPQARIIAEDLGYITADVVNLRRQAGYPGMKIVQFGYGHDDNNVNLPHFYERETVVYTGTHDNDTTRGWLAGLSGEQEALVRRYFGLKPGDNSSLPLVQAALASVARLAVIPVQDLMDLGSEARFNRPGSPFMNWKWRFSSSDLKRLRMERGEQLLEWNRLYDRVGDNRQRDFSAPPAQPESVETALSTY